MIAANLLPLTSDPHALERSHSSSRARAASAEPTTAASAKLKNTQRLASKLSSPSQAFLAMQRERFQETEHEAKERDADSASPPESEAYSGIVRRGQPSFPSATRPLTEQRCWLGAPNYLKGLRHSADPRDIFTDTIARHDRLTR